MNPFKKFKNWIIGETLAKTDDVFDKAKIELTYNFTSFLFALSFLFLGNLVANHYTWEITTTIVSLVMFLGCYFFLKKGDYKSAAMVFLVNQLLMTSIHYYWFNGVLNAMSVFWLLLFILYSFFVLDAAWGISATFYISCLILFGLVNKQMNFSLFNFQLPPEQRVPETPFFIFVPFALNIYMIYEFIKTKTLAEKLISNQKYTLETSCKQLELKNEDIVSSINYAKRIQYAVLPNEDSIYRNVPLSFILYKPRDIVSGDFFWFHEIDRDNYIIVCADCTGHGVPGAFMTVIGSSALNQIVIENKITKPSEILVELDKRITSILKQEKTRAIYVHDGMDLSLIKVNKANKEFVFTSAKRPTIFIRDKQIREFKGSKNTLGGLRSGEKKFEEIKTNYEEDDMIYLFTDGYIDQFGGIDNKKFMIKRFRELLLNIYQLSMNEQKQKLETTINNWIGKNEQTDDITVMGIRF